MPGDKAQTGDEVRLGECPEILYVCESCTNHSPESCGRPYPGEIRRAPNGMWLCDSCYDSDGYQDIDDGEWPSWEKAPKAPDLCAPRPNGEVEKALEELARRAESFWAFVQGEYNVRFTSEDQDDHNVYEFFAALTRARDTLARARAAREEKP